jgi:hypothetical protein
MTMSTARHGWIAAFTVTAIAAAVADGQELKLREDAAPVPDIATLHMTTAGRLLGGGPADGSGAASGGLSGRGPGCQQIAAHTDASFTGGTYSAQAGIVEGEAMAVSYTLPADVFPIKIESIEFLWVSVNAQVQTTTQYSLHVWEGLPPSNMLVAPSPFFSGDEPGDLIPIIVGPGTAGVNVQVSIDPSDPEQLFINNESGTNTFSVGVRIEQHNDQPDGAGCTSPPQSNRNAFPVTDQVQPPGPLGPCSTDFSELQFPTENWIYALACPSGECPSGWKRFSELPSNWQALQCCRPHGDWVMRVKWSSVNCQPGVGACCNLDGTCSLGLQSDCFSSGGTYQGDGTDCGTVSCPQPEFGACCMPDGSCFEDFDFSCDEFGGAFQGVGTTCATANCAEPEEACCFAATMSCMNATASDCTALGGQPQGFGTTCATFECFPMGACCLPDGTCQDGMSPEDCAAADGTYQGNDTVCSGVSCPQPRGACCLSNGNCAVVTESLCSAAGGTWLGMGSDCEDCAGGGCVCEFDGDPSQIDVFDLLAYLDGWFVEDAATDIDGTAGVDVFDLLAFLDCWFPGSAGEPCP